ncbi:hypothetical protein CRUP_025611 [Coryphaenoides rupestris]|nr:hypothetical protein CRUP_025611 [Coryphaenoides rupestris]
MFIIYNILAGKLGQSLLGCFLERVATHPHKRYVVFEDTSYTYRQADAESNKIARVLSSHVQVKEGDTVALFMDNQPLYVWVYLALAKLGCAASLLNCNIRSKSLLHCLSCCDAKVLVAAADLRGAVEEVLPSLSQQGVRVFILEEDGDSGGNRGSRGQDPAGLRSASVPSAQGQGHSQEPCGVHLHLRHHRTPQSGPDYP